MKTISPRRILAAMLLLTLLLTGRLGLHGAWVAMCIELCFRGALFLFCLWRKFWLPKDLREPVQR